VVLEDDVTGNKIKFGTLGVTAGEIILNACG
jgi:hypothetical protein